MAQNDFPPAPPVESSSGPALLGVDLGSNHIRLGVVDPSGKLLAFRREPYSDQSRETSRALADHVLSVTRQMMQEQSGVQSGIRAIGIAFPGLVNQPGQRVVELAQLPALAQLDFHKEFSDAFGLPVRFDSNANSAAFAEKTLGIANGVDDFLYLHIGANVSAGLVLGGQLHHGLSGLAGDLGQMKIYVEHMGESVPLEFMASAANIVRRTQDRLRRDKTSSLSRLGAMGGFSYDDIIAAAHGGDDLAKMMLQRTGHFIAMALADVVSLLNLSLIAVGGAPAARNFMVPAIADEVRERVSDEAFRDCQIVAAEIGAEAGVIGAALLSNHSH
ncbi:MAG: ROK family protein [Blastocatellia bacterium]